jgi:16S rRNA processing protein RimM
VEPNGVVAIGKIVGAHGLNGTSKVFSYAESLSIFTPNRSITLRQPEGRERTYVIQWAKPHTRCILLALEGVTDRDQAESLIGSELLIPKSSLPEPEEGTYYWFDLIGLSVYTTDGLFLGRLESIIPTGSNDVYVVRPHADPEEERDEVLIPAIESVVREIDLERKVMRVELPEVF